MTPIAVSQLNAQKILLVIFLFHKAVDIGFEAREFLIEIARKFQVIDNGLIEALAGNQQRDARRIGRDQRRGDATFELVDLDAVIRIAPTFSPALARRAHVWLAKEEIEKADKEKAETLLTSALVLYASDVSTGRVRANRVDKEIDIVQRKVDRVDLLKAAAEALARMTF